jgi:membrane protein implicated in regulation of membrane protease activity
MNRDLDPGPSTSKAASNGPPGDAADEWRVRVPHPIRAKGSLSAEDLIGASELTGQMLSPVAVIVVLVVVTPLVGGLFLLKEGLSTLTLVIGVAVPIFVVVAVFFQCRLTRRRLNRTAEELEESVGPMEFAITDEAFASKSKAAEWRRTWNGFSKWMRSDRVVLLYPQSSTEYLVVPRSFFAGDDDWNLFLRLLESKLPRKR